MKESAGIQPGGSHVVPQRNAHLLLFADLRGLWTDVHAAEGNWGLAFRRMDGDWVTGILAVDCNCSAM